MSMVTALIYWLPLITALLATLFFVLSYSRVRFEETPEGRNIMSLGALILFVIVVTIFNRTFEGAKLEIAAFVWLTVAALMTHRSILLFRAQHPKEKEEEK